MARSKNLVEESEVIDAVQPTEDTVSEEVIDETAASDTLHPNAMPVGPANKSAAIGRVVNALANMPAETINKFCASIEQIGHEADSIPGGEAAKNRSTIDTKPSNAGVQLVTKLNWANEETEARISDIIKEDVSSLFDGEDVSDDFKGKVAIILESTINLKVDQAVVALEESFEKRYDDEIEEITESLIDTFDSYLDYAVGEWIDQNKVAIESTLKSDLTEEFIESLKALFETHYVKVPEDRIDIVAEMNQKIEDLELQTSQKIDEIQELRNIIASKDAEIVVAEAVKGLVDTDAEKLRELSETVEFSTVDELKSKIGVLKETYFGAETVVSAPGSVLFEEAVKLVEDTDKPNLSKSMNAYVNAIGKVAGK